MRRRGGSTCALFWELELGLLGLCFSPPPPPAADRVQESQQESILLPLNVVKRRGRQGGEGKFKAVLKKVGRFREGDVRNIQQGRRGRPKSSLLKEPTHSSNRCYEVMVCMGSDNCSMVYN